MLLGVIGVAIVVILVFFWDRTEPYPDEWDPRVLDLVEFVEQDRGLTFNHPVNVVFITPAEIDAEVQQDGSLDSYTTADASLDELVEIYRAWGLAEGSFDPVAAQQGLGSAAEAFYDPNIWTVVVPAPEGFGPEDPIPLTTRVTLVHELTHALQHQRFPAFGPGTGDSEVALGILEGDASLVESHYRAQLSRAEQQQYFDEINEGVEEYEAGVVDVPPILLAEFADSYVLGEAFVGVLWDDGGFARVNRAFTSPPDGMEAMVDPHQWLATQITSRDLAFPNDIVPADADVLLEVTAGPVQWFLSFSEAMPLADAVRGARAWGGDSSVVYRSADDTVCVASRLVAGRDAERDDLIAALDGWVERMPDHRAVVDGSGIVVTGCDPGPEADLALPNDMVFLFLALRYTQEGESWALEEDLPIEVGRCQALTDLASFDVLDRESLGDFFQFSDRERADIAADCLAA